MNNRRIFEALGLFGLLLASIPLFVKSDFVFVWDMQLYVSYLRSIQAGLGFVDVFGHDAYHRPGFTMIMHLWTSAFGLSAQSLMWFTVIWSALFCWVTFLWARRFLGLGPALVTWAALIAAPGLWFYLPRHIDPVWPTLVLGGLLMLDYAISHLVNAQPRRLVVTAGLGGLLLIAAMTVKPVAVLAVLPALWLCWQAWRTGGSGPRTALRWRYFGALAVGVSVWFVLLAVWSWAITWPVSGDEGGLLSVVGEKASYSSQSHLSRLIQDFLGSGIAGFLAQLWQAFTTYLLDERSGIQLLSPLVLVALPLVFLAVLRPRLLERYGQETPQVDSQRAQGVLLCLILGFGPLMLYVGSQGFRPSQVLISVALLAIGLGYGARLILAQVPGSWSRWAQPAFAILLAGAVAAASVAFSSPRAERLGRLNAALFDGAVDQSLDGVKMISEVAKIIQNAASEKQQTRQALGCEDGALFRLWVEGERTAYQLAASPQIARREVLFMPRDFNAVAAQSFDQLMQAGPLADMVITNIGRDGQPYDDLLAQSGAFTKAHTVVDGRENYSIWTRQDGQPGC